MFVYSMQQVLAAALYVSIRFFSSIESRMNLVFKSQGGPEWTVVVVNLPVVGGVYTFP